jgi:hypothetical protein
MIESEMEPQELQRTQENTRPHVSLWFAEIANAAENNRVAELNHAVIERDYLRVAPLAGPMLVAPLSSPAGSPRRSP